ncbi:MAG: hypothetical protein HC902_07135 [Calothrix sp. SM1_5_4]|nr:hypothetical protein [Calothrix sp. SM1_5_4]
MFDFNFVISARSGQSFSLDPKDSDSIHNHNLLDQLVGTLVKYSASGRIEPFLAESWVELDNGRHWQFKMRSGLRCEDGSLITASSYVDSLTTQLREYADWSSLINFNDLKGFRDFKTGTARRIDGLFASQDMVNMIFDHPPEQLLEFLQWSILDIGAGTTVATWFPLAPIELDAFTRLA